jgi:carbon dioxide concentrating mechanism protein CcmN
VYLPPLQAMHDSQVYISGDVTIHPNAAIAPGVLLQASPGSSIIIAAGACIGMGAVLHSYDGILEIQEGASLGAGVLMVGAGVIGANACIGSQCTLLNTSVETKILVPSGSVLGDGSRQLQPEAEAVTPPTVPISSAAVPEAAPLAPLPDPWISAAAQPVAQPISEPSNFSVPSLSVSESNDFNTFKYPENSHVGSNPFKYPDSPSLSLSSVTEGNTAIDETEKVLEKTPNVVHGQAYVHDLLSTLLPNRSRSVSPSPDS